VASANTAKSVADAEPEQKSTLETSLPLTQHAPTSLNCYVKKQNLEISFVPEPIFLLNR
jgi:hypothetical protein